MYALALQSNVEMCVFIMCSALWNDSLVWLPLHLALALATAHMRQLLEDGTCVCTLFSSQMSSSPHAAQVTNVRQSGDAAETSPLPGLV